MRSGCGRSSRLCDESAPRDKKRVMTRTEGRGRDLGVLVGAVWLSAGDFLALVPLALHVQETTASRPAVAALFIALWLPVVVLAGHAGLLVDRFDARKLLVVVQGLGLGLPPLWLSLSFLLGAALVGGLGHAVKNTLARTLIHERVPERLHGRAFAAYNGLRNGAEMAALAAGGVLVAVIGARWTLLVAGWLPIAVGLVALAVHRRMERGRVELPEPASAPVP